MGPIDRDTTPRLAAAIVSWRIVVGVGVGIALAAAGLPIGVAIAVGVALFAAFVGATMADGPDGPDRPAVDPFTVGEPWRLLVQRAMSADRRFQETVAQMTDGPLRSTFADLGERIGRSVDEAWAIARRGDEIDDAVRRLDPTTLRSRLVSAEQAAAEHPSDDAAATVASLRRQVEAADRLRALSDETVASLRLTQIRLDELVARASEVQAGTVDTETYERDVDDLVVRLEALHQAIDEVERA